MAQKQRIIFLSTVFLIAVMGFCPPWKEAGPKGLPLSWAPIFAPPTPKRPENGMEIDFARLFLQIGVLAVLSGGLQMTFQDPKNKFEQFKQSTNPFNTVTVVPPVAQPDPNKNKAEIKEVQLSSSELKEVTSPQFDILELPAHLAIGEFLIESDEDPDSWEWLADAKGTIKVPRGKSIQLEVVKDKPIDFALLKRIPPQILDSMDLSESEIKDEDLINLKRFTRLKELDLSGTSVKALESLTSIKSLRKLWLDNTEVDDACIAKLADLSKLQKLSLKETKVTDAGVDKLKASLNNCKIEV